MQTSTRPVGWIVGALALIVGGASPAGAQDVCFAGKVKAASQRAVCKSLLEAAEARTNLPAKPTALARCATAYDKSFAKAEALGGCATAGDAAAVAADVDDFVAALATALDVTVPAEPSKCESAKIKAAAKKASCLLKLVAAFNAKPHRPPSGLKTVKCGEALDRTFERIEDAMSCNTTGDKHAIGQLVDAFVHAVADRGPVLESGCIPVTAVAVHGDDPFYGNTRITPITGGKVPCVHVETLKRTTCAFRPDSGDWIETASGNYALLGQWVSKSGDPDGEYTVAAEIREDLAVPCIEPSGNDLAGTETSQELATTCQYEWFMTERNGALGKLFNFATQPVCTSSVPHPEQTLVGPILVECGGDSPGYCCYTGRGAGLNAPNGTERDENGFYLSGSHRCHVATSSGVEVYAAKRPAARLALEQGFNVWVVDPFSKLVWRPVSKADIANY